ncbi:MULTISPECIES: ACR3 family arsenite efflux transporter [Aerococcus]|uniref:ACR3 family arsenite efflux transporter n=1 Tax=Aerococcus sanguinicola TaxID=119206 RepID=A0A5N1GJQ9_9LACT|nr:MULTISPECIES: ACR3 family arsenite efflux transporter [Aerococcus]KAA9300528.1 ACR3 family arsenite efflux transporter [Aerococcus sanguinicola]MDK6370168.1 ACR3 family arsenite efflux transporter [Aerococcus sp. UMB9870]MDK6680292.1 ACR3 family arsenite efflux transporter [Aerococcus sp. UMB8608]MDK6686872.1 ACR3 family arsenite efflux transporter [Aerococcus sp. UMB8623]MDK6939983.1 ACR3 family arsenite efflux transporter [Aerococcus sp. UMB8487]
MSKTKAQRPMSFFSQYLTFWVLICMVIGIIIGYGFPTVPEFLRQFEFYNVSIPTTILLWIMIFPMFLTIDFSSIKKVKEHPKGLWITWIVNWLIKPLTMYGLAYLFFFIFYQDILSTNEAVEYLAGAVLLGAAPCTAMTLVWSKLSGGNPSYTLVQVATNDLIILIAYIPIVSFLLGFGDIHIPWETLLLSITLFIITPLIAAILIRNVVIKSKGQYYLDQKLIPSLDKFTNIGLLLTLIFIFTVQAEKIIQQPMSVLLIAIPLILQNIMVFALAYSWAYFANLPYTIAAPCGLIGSSNFFELAVAVAISVFGIESGATLTTVVGVLVEVPVMLMLVRIANSTEKYFQY